MKLLIKFPTRGRFTKFFNTFQKYKNLLSGTIDVKFLITMDNDDKEMNKDLTVEILKQYQNVFYYFGNSKTKIEAVNADLDKINDWDIILLASDDMIPQVKGYDQVIIEKMKKHFPDTDGVLWFNDGHQKEKLNTLCILGKKYYNRFGYIYNPEYKSMWCDNEFMSVANILGKQKYFPEVIIKHEHPDIGFGGRDQIHIDNVKNESYDKSIFLKNKSNNFGLTLN